MTKAEKIAAYDPNEMGKADNNLFSLPFTEDESDIIIVPVPWDVTVSYGAGTSESADAIMDASLQVDLYDADAPDAWQAGYYMIDPDESLAHTGRKLRDQAEEYMENLAEDVTPEDDKHQRKILDRINEACAHMNDYVYTTTLQYLQKGKMVGVLGGDHSTPLGYIRALAEWHDNFGILQIDAHCDLRPAYEGFTYSHASIMYNVLEEIPAVESLLQLGIRDYSHGEWNYICNSHNRVRTFFDKDIKRRQFTGESWHSICMDIVHQLPRKVYISFDIDGLNPLYCPHTGTPVPGGLEPEQVYYLFKLIVDSGRTIIGFDLNEVCPADNDANEWDANVGARVLYKLCNMMVASRK